MFHQKTKFCNVLVMKMGCGGVAVRPMPCDWRVAGSNLPQAAV